MIEVFKNKEFKLHSSGLWVSKDGEVYVPTKYRKYPNGHFTYGWVKVRGYLSVQYKGKEYQVHRLVAECYIDNTENLPTVDHINRNPSDNRVENLRWASYSLQVKNRELPKNDGHSKKVYQYTLSGILVREWPSTQECSRNGFIQGEVSNCCRGKCKTHKGFIWSYEPLFDM